MKIESSETTFSENFRQTYIEKINLMFRVLQKLEMHADANEMTAAIQDGLEYASLLGENETGSIIKGFCYLALGEEEKGIASITEWAKKSEIASLYILKLKGVSVVPENYLYDLPEEEPLLEKARSLFLSQNYQEVIQTVDAYLGSRTSSWDDDEALRLRSLAKGLSNDFEGALEDSRELGYGQFIIHGAMLKALGGNPESAKKDLRSFYMNESDNHFRFTEENFKALLVEHILDSENR